MSVKRKFAAEHSVLRINTANGAIWIGAWSVAVMAWPVIAAFEGMAKPSRPLGFARLYFAAGVIAPGLFVADETWPGHRPDPEHATRGS